MEDIRQDSITAFDTCFTNNHIRMLKVILPFFHGSLQKDLAVYIKYRELQYVLYSFRSSRPGPHAPFSFLKAPDSFDFNKVCEELLPYCNEQEKQQFTEAKNLFKSLQNLQEMMGMMKMMKELFPEGVKFEDGFNPDILSELESLFEGPGRD